MLYPKEYVYNANCPPIKYIQQEIQINFEDKSTFLMDARFYDENFRTLERVQVYEASSDSILFNNIKKAFDRVYVKVRAKQIGEEW
jgi:hypothetical protein